MGERCAGEYDRLVGSGAGRSIEWTLRGLGYLYSRIGRENAFDHFSDDMAIYTNAFVLFLTSGEGDEKTLESVRVGLRGMWQFLRYSRKSYMTFIHAVMAEISDEEREQALETLRMFPGDKRVVSDLESQDAHSVQPIADQAINSHYWKSDYFRKVSLTGASGKVSIAYSGQDYLFVY
jgi:hypothetical protein